MTLFDLCLVLTTPLQCTVIHTIDLEQLHVYEEIEPISEEQLSNICRWPILLDEINRSES